jgi:hypothetical protein
MGREIVECGITVENNLVKVTIPESTNAKLVAKNVTNETKLEEESSDTCYVFTTTGKTFDLTYVITNENIASNAPVTIVFHSPVKVQYKDNTEVIKNLLANSTNSNNNYLFDYSNKGDDTQIVDPWNPASFVKYNHPYNPFTICQWNLTNVNNDIVVLNNVRG